MLRSVCRPYALQVLRLHQGIGHRPLSAGTLVYYCSELPFKVFLYFLNLSRFTTVVRGLLTLPLMLHLRGVTIWYVGRHFAALTGYRFALTTDTQRTVPMIPYNQTETSENRKKKNDETGLLL